LAGFLLDEIGWLIVVNDMQELEFGLELVAQ
jgi:hypothetical protein